MELITDKRRAMTEARTSGRVQSRTLSHLRKGERAEGEPDLQTRRLNDR